MEDRQDGVRPGLLPSIRGQGRQAPHHAPRDPAHLRSPAGFLAINASALGLIFFLSGATGLLYEVLWTRSLTLVFGHTLLAASTVLAAYMGGLGLGGLAGGRWADRRAGRTATLLRLYGRLEAGIGLTALLTVPLLHLVGQAHLLLIRGGVEGPGLRAASFMLAAAVLLGPTLLMGATLPVMAASLRGAPLGRLYGLNTLGACLGAALAGYVLLPGAGWTVSFGGAVGLSFLLAWLAARCARSAPEETPAEALPEPPSAGALVPWALACSGAASMALQIGWTRGLVLTLGSSTYAFSSVLTLFLAGLGLGGLLYALRPPSSPLPAHLGGLLLGAGLWAGVSCYLLGLLPQAMARLTPLSGFGTVLGLQLLLAGLVLGGPTIMLGASFPLAVDLTGGRPLGRRIGALYAANTLGCVAGAVAVGLGTLPAWGAQVTLKGASVLLLSAGVALVLRTSPHLAQRLTFLLGGCLAAFIVLALPPWSPGWMSAGTGIYGGLQPSLGRLPIPFWYRDGATSTVSLHAGPSGGLAMRVNGKIDASDRLLDLTTQYLLGFIPALYVKPRSAAVIGLGSGMTLEALSLVPGLERLDCVELEPQVIAAFPYWQAYNGQVGRDPRLHLAVADGRSWLETTDRRYDVIVSEPSNVWVAGVGNLYTREFYRACKSRLTEDGVMAQWFQNYSVGAEELGMVVNTFFDVFPDGSLWFTSMEEHDLVLIGSRHKISLDVARVKALARVPALRRRLGALGLSSELAILGHYACSREAALGLFGHVRFNTDDRPSLEFQAARRMYLSLGARLRGTSGLLTDATRVLPEGIPLETDVLRQAAEGWIASREPAEVARLWGLQPPDFHRDPWVRALASTLAPKVTPKELVQAFQPLLERAGSVRSAAYQLAVLLQARQDYGDAAQLYEAAATQPPPGTEVQLWINLGTCYSYLGQWDKAAAAFGRAGDGYEALTLLGDARLRQERPAEALRCYLRAVAQNSIYVPALWGQGQAWLGLHDFTRAASAFREFLELVPSHPQALTNLAYCYVQLEDKPAAAQTYRTLLKYWPDNANALHNLYELEKSP